MTRRPGPRYRPTSTDSAAAVPFRTGTTPPTHSGAMADAMRGASAVLRRRYDGCDECASWERQALTAEGDTAHAARTAARLAQSRADHTPPPWALADVNARRAELVDAREHYAAHLAEHERTNP